MTKDEPKSLLQKKFTFQQFFDLYDSYEVDAHKKSYS